METEKLNKENNKNIEDITCPSCGLHRFFLKFYCEKVINYCQDCGFWDEV